MITFLKLIRYKNLLMVLLTMVLTKYALITYAIKNTYLSHLEFFILAVSILLITAGGYIINDIFDIETDKINKPSKIFIDKTISKKNAWITYFTTTFLGLVLGFYISIYKNLPLHSLYFIFTIVSLFVYSKYLKNKFLIGNILVSLLCALVIYLMYSFDFRIDKNAFLENLSNHKINNLQLGTIFIKYYILFSFLTTLIREIIKDIEDINGDLKISAKTLPILVGRKRAAKVAFFFSSILLIALLLVLQITQDNLIFLVYNILFLLLPILYFMYQLWFAGIKKDFSKLSSILKLIMLFGIVSMVFFRFLDF